MGVARMMRGHQQPGYPTYYDGRGNVIHPPKNIQDWDKFAYPELYKKEPMKIDFSKIMKAISLIALWIAGMTLLCSVGSFMISLAYWLGG